MQCVIMQPHVQCHAKWVHSHHGMVCPQVKDGKVSRYVE
jgi:hypothetical protein